MTTKGVLSSVGQVTRHGEKRPQLAFAEFVLGLPAGCLKISATLFFHPRSGQKEMDFDKWGHYPLLQI